MIRMLFCRLSDLMTLLKQPSLAPAGLDDCFAELTERRAELSDRFDELTACLAELTTWVNGSVCSVRQAGRLLREAGGAAQATCSRGEVSVRTEQHHHASLSRAPISVSQVTCRSAQPTIRTSSYNNTRRRERPTAACIRPCALLSASDVSHHLSRLAIEPSCHAARATWPCEEPSRPRCRSDLQRRRDERAQWSRQACTVIDPTCCMV